MTGLKVRPEERFWRKVNKNGPIHSVLGTECWLWTGKTARFGHGWFVIPSINSLMAHRFSWELHRGPIPDGMCVCHHCDNPPCVNPSHLWLGTRADNTRDMYKKGRGVSWNAGWTHCSQGHEYTPENTRIDRHGWRTCRACKVRIAHELLVERREPPHHGRITSYTNYGCRCEECVLAYRTYAREKWRKNHPGCARRKA